MGPSSVLGSHAAGAPTAVLSQDRDSIMTCICTHCTGQKCLAARLTVTKPHPGHCCCEQHWLSSLPDLQHAACRTDLHADGQHITRDVKPGHDLLLAGAETGMPSWRGSQCLDRWTAVDEQPKKSAKLPRCDVSSHTAWRLDVTQITHSQSTPGWTAVGFVHTQ